MEVLSTLLPLLEGRRLFVPSRGESLEAAPGFQLFATQRSGSSTGGTSSQLLQAHFTIITLTEPLTKDLIMIIQQRFPKLHDLAEALVRTFENLRSLKTNVSTSDPAVKAAGRHLKPLSVRDLMRWASRIAG